MTMAVLSSFKAWSRQPTSVAGISAFAGTLASLYLGQIDFHHAIPLLVGAAIGMALPDNAGAKTAAVTLATAIEDATKGETH